MATPNLPPPFSTSSTYTQMDTADLDALGAHCEFTYCHQLDFLPFRCDSCHHTYCLDHRSETAHQCVHAGEWARNRLKNNTTTITLEKKPTLLTAQQCSDLKCKTLINTLHNTGVHCPTCNRTYCLKHRMREDHDCAKLTPLGACPTASGPTNAEKLRTGFSRLLSKTKDSTSSIQTQLRPKPKPTSRAAQLTNLNNLKRTAKGDEKIPVEKRIYLHVEAESDTTKSKFPKADLWFHDEWSVGRMLDEAARRLQVVNANNRVESEEERLRVYHIEGGRVLGFNEKVGRGVGSGNTIVLLRGVGGSEG